MGWLIALALLAGLLCIPLGISASYDASGAVVKVILGPFRWRLYPARRKSEKKAKHRKAKKTGKTTKKQEKNGGSLSDFFPMIDLVLEFLSDVRRKIRVNLLDIRILLAGDDPCDLGILYARTLTAVHALDPQLERLFVIRKKDIRVECDFTGDRSHVWAKANLTLTVGRILSLGFRHGWKALREYLNIMKLRKGGATK